MNQPAQELQLARQDSAGAWPPTRQVDRGWAGKTRPGVVAQPGSPGKHVPRRGVERGEQFVPGRWVAQVCSACAGADPARRGADLTANALLFAGCGTATAVRGRESGC